MASRQTRAPRVKTILGIDPGSQVAGFGVVRVHHEAGGERIEYVTCGVIAPPAGLEFNDRIGVVAEEFEALLARFRPDITVIERVFLGKNADSAFKLGHARGVALAAAVRAGSEIVEYPARLVKKGITGNGAADKEQVQVVLFAALGLKGRAIFDASDALALAYYHGRCSEVERKTKEAEL